MIGSSGRDLHEGCRNQVSMAYSGFALLVLLSSIMIMYVATQIKLTTPANLFYLFYSYKYFLSHFSITSSHSSSSSLLNQRSHNAPTSTTMSRSLARRIPDDVWNFHKITIWELYIVEDRKLDGYDGVMDVMTRRYGF